MQQNERYKIIELLCTSENENIQLAEALCDSQGWDLTEILKEFGYYQIKLKRADDFRYHILDCSKLGLDKLPDLLPANLESLFCFGNQLTALPNLPAKLKLLSCGDNKLVVLPNLPLSLEDLYCSNNLISNLPDLPQTLQELRFDNNQLTDLPKLPLNLRSLHCKNNLFNILPDKIKALAPKNCYIVCDTLEEIAAKKLIWTEAENVRLLTLRDKRGLSYNEMQPYFINRTVEQIVLQYRKLKQ